MVRTSSDAAAAADSKSARTRLRILDAAAEVLSARGYAGARLGEIAARADVQAPAIYYYFASREDLVEEVLHTGAARMRQHLVSVLDALPDGASALDRLSVAVEEHLRHLLDPTTYAAAAIKNAAQVPDAVRRRHAVEQRAYDDMWAHLLTAAQESGELQADLDLRLAQGLVTGALNHVGDSWDPQHGDLEARVAGARSFVLRGLS